MTTSANAPAITEETVRRLSQRHEEPEWLLQRRLDAWRAFETMAMPDPLEEEWRRTDISGLDVEETLRKVGQDLDRSSRDQGRVGLEVVPAGPASRLVYASLTDAAKSHPDLVKESFLSLISPTEWKLQALAAALHDQAAVIYVPRGADIEAPITHLVRASGTGIFPYLLIVADENSSVTVLQETESGDAAEHILASGAVEIIARQDAQVRFIESQRWGENAYAFSTIRARLDRGAQLQASLIGLGSRLSKTKLEVSLEGEGAYADLLGLSLGDGKQHFDYITLQDHLAPRTSSNLLFKSALDDESSQVWTGTVRIHKDAGASEANQASRNLLLSDKAKAAPIPVLEIEAYDVLRCSHGATAGPLDTDQLFYLESRGIAPIEAERLLVEAFFREVVDRLPESVDRERLQEAIAGKIGVRR
jgi:Fe-S cluster assembly protein SufD